MPSSLGLDAANVQSREMKRNEAKREKDGTNTPCRRAVFSSRTCPAKTFHDPRESSRTIPAQGIDLDISIPGEIVLGLGSNDGAAADSWGPYNLSLHAGIFTAPGFIQSPPIL